MNSHMILGVHLTDRLQHAQEVQKLLTEFGSHIKTRLGLHDVRGDSCMPGGMILLEMVGEEKHCEQLAERLRAVQGVEVQMMIFRHPH